MTATLHQALQWKGAVRITYVESRRRDSPEKTTWRTVAYTRSRQRRLSDRASLEYDAHRLTQIDPRQHTDTCRGWTTRQSCAETSLAAAHTGDGTNSCVSCCTRNPPMPSRTR
ncbi:hypothetical protein TraAM80_07421 [Trypanosoma rangeli]|uniref:Uncharacterized protein n=1 Tax=Trypanosoma rangeli TaxID=5698 RepID=A0A3R7KT02_TRYRA|nr:uncharacterized protein TraAM80_07421 [Trypanosoma rangeli]RNF00767.1 hypothetical protein TraAM80_07421 [Trypanosoma rangeli]|eukprot:RNF00767.1 hypothetical protein TraAM80_07421 [Trypanosoma rangeli]